MWDNDPLFPVAVLRNTPVKEKLILILWFSILS